MPYNRLSFIIFGATSFTGRLAVLTLDKLIKEYPGLEWGIAGRSKEKLNAITEELEEKTGNIYHHVRIIIADIKNETSLQFMTAQTKVLLNCCGPFRISGEPLIKACIETRTNYVDISSEPLYMERMQLAYHEDAKRKFIYIVNGCGFVSIAADLGTIFVQDHFEGTVNSVETYLYTMGKVHYTNCETILYGLAQANELNKLRDKLYPKKLPEFKPKLMPSCVIHKGPVDGNWSVSFPGAGGSAVMRSQRHFYDNDSQRPAQTLDYVSFPSLFTVLLLSLFESFVATLCRWSWGRKLLLKYPRLFTGDFFSHDGPTEQNIEKMHPSMTFVAHGWKDKQTDAYDQYQEPPNKVAVARVTGNEGYRKLNATAIVLSGLMVLHHWKEMPDVGGVYPPGAAFARTPLTKNLHENGITFEMISIKEN